MPTTRKERRARRAALRREERLARDTLKRLQPVPSRVACPCPACQPGAGLACVAPGAA